MIRPIDIKLNAAHPELPLVEATTFTGAPSSVFIRGVPKSVGNWSITAVNVAVTYPDNSTTTRAAVESAEGVWVATIPGTATSGRTVAGFRILADGIDENGAAVTGYVLGFADFSVFSFLPVPAPGETFFYLRYFDTMPTAAKKMDVTTIGGVLKYYNGTTWLPFTDFDNTVTPTSANGVKSSGIWSMIWGALSAIPTGFSSLYDWVVDQLAGKLDTSGGIVTGDIFTNSSIWLTSSGQWTGVIQIDGDGALQSLEGGVNINASFANIIKTANGLSTHYADRVSNPTTGNLAALDANGNLTDSNNTVQGTFGCGELVVGYSPTQPDQRYVDIIAQGAVPDHSTIIVYNSDSLGHFHYIALPNSDGADKEGILALEHEIAPAFDDTATYAEDALVYYNDALYRCTTAVTSAGAWTGSTNWTEASVEDVLAALRSVITGKADVSAIPYSLGTPTVIDSSSVQTDTTDPNNPIDYGAATLANRTANIVQVTAATALDELRITFPAATSGKVRDFGLRVEIGTGSAALTAPALVPIAPTGETIKIENADGTIPELADGTATAKGVTLLYFSETAPGVFVVKGEQVEEVA